MAEISSTTLISKNFKLNEFLDKSSKDISERISFEPLFLWLLPWLQTVRTEVGAPLKITSFFRNPEDNEAAGGSKGSAHLRGFAVDFCIPSMYDYPADQKKLFKRLCLLHPDIRVGYYAETVKAKPFYHIDCGRIYDSSSFPAWQQMR